ncbi:glycosyltransferase family 2 protein [Salinigranum halophilum]|jgi:glycosyltransferase involved in cell wall biosynthesis|uniref:glycosyltransferase family 2 protein n=1 Tax=Salinigranum halophilum TaxID=2565931 RepID=UPI00115D9EB3|nr:glycosyltransferase [Salinigranum halophilum]
MVELSIIIPTIKPASEIDCLRYLETQDFDDYEVVIRSDPGASKARNEAIKRANAEKLVFLDDDSMPRPGYLQAVSDALDEHDVVAGRVFQPDDAVITYKQLPWYDQGDEGKHTDLIVGCNMAMRKSVLDAVGGFNETFFHGHEETELGRRISEQFDIWYEPSMVVEHYYAFSVRQYWEKSYRHGKADADWWVVDDVPLSTRLRKCLPTDVLRRQPIETVAMLVLTFGRVRRLTAQLLGLVDIPEQRHPSDHSTPSASASLRDSSEGISPLSSGRD